MDEPSTVSPELLAEYEKKGEAAYAAMYDAPSWDEKDLKDDALFYFARAIEIADELQLAEDGTRLRARVENIVGVYNSQFRGNFRA